MTTPVRIGVIVAPSAQMGAWRRAIAARAVKLGFRLLKSAGEADRDESYVLFSKGMSSLVVSDADTWIVVAGSTSELVATTMEEFKGSPRDAIRAIAGQLSALCKMYGRRPSSGVRSANQ